MGCTWPSRCSQENNARVTLLQTRIERKTSQSNERTALLKSFDPVKEKDERISFVTEKYGSEK